ARLLRPRRRPYRLPHRPGVLRRPACPLRATGTRRTGHRSTPGSGVSGAPPLALREARPLLGPVADASRALPRARACLGALCTELLTFPAGTDEVKRQHHAALAAHRLARRALDINGVHVTVAGRVPSGPVVLACNHLGYLDPIVLGALLPLAAIAKSELARWPLLGRAAARLGTLFVRRGSPHDGAVVLRQALRRLAAGIPLLNF